VLSLQLRSLKRQKQIKKIAISPGKKTFTKSSRNVKLDKIKKLETVIKELFAPASALSSNENDNNGKKIHIKLNFSQTRTVNKWTYEILSEISKFTKRCN
jgi:hypothetical protein